MARAVVVVHPGSAVPTHRLCIDPRVGWSSISDVGRAFGGVVLTAEAYLEAENAFVALAEAGHGLGGGGALDIQGVERRATRRASSIPGELVPDPRLVEDARFSPSALPALIRTCLREEAWYRLRTPHRGFEVHFGWDFTMYLVCPPLPDALLVAAREKGLAIREGRSPHWPEGDETNRTRR